MIYMSVNDGALKIIILGTENLDRLKQGLPAHSPDNSVLIAWTPDLERLAKELGESGGDAELIGRLIDESKDWPEKPYGPYHAPKTTEFTKVEFPK